MKVFKKQLSLEQFKSRMPGIVPAYDEYGVKHTFNTFGSHSNEPITNYNMIPCNIHVDIDEQLNFGEYSGKILSYNELVKLFHEFDKNKSIIIDTKCDTDEILSYDKEKFYNWMLDNCFPFFLFEKELKGYPLQIKKIIEYWECNRLSLSDAKKWVGKLQSLKSKCEVTLLNGNVEKRKTKDNCCEFNDYENRGGDIMLNVLDEWCTKRRSRVLCHINDYSNTSYRYEITDEDTEVVLKTLKESEDGSRYVCNHAFKIYKYKTKILGRDKYIKYGHLNKKNELINTSTIDVVDNIVTIEPFDLSPEHLLIYSEPSFLIPLYLSNNISNIGQFSEMVDEWQEGYEYNNNFEKNYDLNYSGGNIVFYNGENWILKSYDYPGYIYSEKYKEIYFGSEEGMSNEEKYYYEDEDNFFKIGYSNNTQWEKHTETFPKLENVNHSYYTYKGNKLILDPNPFIMGEEYLIDVNEYNGFRLVNNKIQPLFSCKYTIIKNRKYQIFYDDETTEKNPHVFFNQKKLYINPTENAIDYGSSFYQIGEYIDFCLDEDKIDGYIEDYNGESLYFKFIGVDDWGGYELKTEQLSNFITMDEMSSQSNLWEGYTTYNNGYGYILKIAKPYVIYRNDLISGETTSKIETLIDFNNIAVDNLGNTLKGLMPYKEFTFEKDNKTQTLKIHTTSPTSNEWLCIPYVPGYVSNLSIIDENDDKYYGNIIKSVTLTYKINTSDEEILTIFRNKVGLNNIKTEIIDSYRTIDENGEQIHYIYSYEAKHICETNEALKDTEFFLSTSLKYIDNVTCYIEYYIDTILTKDKSGTYSLLLKNNTDYYGIKYIDYFKLSKKEVEYYIDDYDFCILNYWEMEPYTKTYENQNYNITISDEPTSQFEFIIHPFEISFGFLYKNFGTTKFYKVKETDLSVTINIDYTTNTYPIYIKNGKKYFSYALKQKDKLYKNYNYFCVINGNRFDIIFDETTNVYILNTGVNEENHEEIIYKSTDGLNYFIDDDGGLLVEEVYCEMPLKYYFIHSEGTFDKYFDFSNETTFSPIFMQESNLGFVTKENINADIYIDRGTVRAFDYHLNLLSAKSLESLEQIGNGFFKFINNNE